MEQSVKNKELYNQSIDLQKEMNDIDRAEFDAGVPMWDKDTININGVERAVTNSSGKKIAHSEKSLRMFYEWFGDSKVVDAEGRPLVVYHGTNAKFSEFQMKEIGLDFPEAAYFSSKEQVAETYTYRGIILPVYLRFENPYIVNANERTFNSYYDDFSSAMYNTLDDGHDGLIVKNIRDDKFQGGGEVADTYVAFSPNQIKSTSNTGTFSKASDNIRYQIAGPRAKTAALDKLEQAKNLQKSGVDNEEIRQQTGWFLGADKKWRFEIPDGKLREDFDIEAHRKWWDDYDGGSSSAIITPLEDIYDNERLYEAYPELRQLPVQFSNALGDDTLGVSFGGSISISSEYLNKDNPEYIKEKERLENTEEYKEYSATFESEPINNDYEGWHRMTEEAQNKFFSSEVGKEYHDLMWGKDYKIKRKISGLSGSAKSTLVHEIQHEIQKIEGFAKGGSAKYVVQEIKDIAESLHYKTLGNLKKYQIRQIDYLMCWKFTDFLKIPTKY